MELIKQLEPVLDAVDSSAIAVENGTITYMNSTALARYGELRDRDFSAEFCLPPDSEPAPNGLFTVFFRSRALLFSRVCYEGGLTVYLDTRPLEDQVLGLTTEQFAKLEGALAVTMTASKYLNLELDDSGQLHELLDGEERDPQKHIRTIHHGMAQIRRLIQNRSMVSVMERGQLPMLPLIIDTGKVCAELCGTLGLFTHRRGLKLGFTDLTTGPAYIRCQRNMFETMLLNLLVNSFEHMAEGGRVELTLRTMGRNVLVSVDDDGEGIGTEPMEKAAAGGPSGECTGLRLVNCSARLLGGSFLIEGRSGQGTRARLVLPVVENCTREELRQSEELSRSVGSGSGLSGMDLILTQLADWLDTDDYDYRLMD